VQTLAPFARGAGTGIAANPALQRAAFSETLVQDGTVSDPIEIGPNHSVLIRVTQHNPARAQPLAQGARPGDRSDPCRSRRQGAAAAPKLVAQFARGARLQDVAAPRN
jgi:peptidyl-prolyl cis-trans isomerase D